MKYLLFLFFIVIGFSACKKDTIIESIETVVGGSKDSLSYQPSVPGSSWIYTRTIPLFPTVDYNFVSLNYDTSHLGFTFHVFSDDLNGNQYIRQDGGKYYTIFTPGTTKPQLLVLDTSKAINQSWVGGVNGDETFTYTIKEKIPSLVIDALTFRNVYRVYNERTKTISGIVTTSGDIFYAQGIGLIKSDLVIVNAGVSVPVSIKIKRATIK
jgi:hypothetical protein